MKFNENIGIVLVLILVAGFVAISPFAFGTTTLGINEMQFSGTDSILSGPVWAIHFTEGGLAQHITGYVGSGTKESDSDRSTEKPFKLDVVNSVQYCEYPIDIDYSSNEISKLYYAEYSSLYSFDTIRNKCVEDFAGSYNNIVAVYNPSYSFKDVCVYKQPQSSRIATFNQDSLVFKTDFEMTVGTRNIPASISNVGSSGSNMVKFSDVGYVKWIGNLVSGDTCPDPADVYKAAYSNDRWNIISTYRYDRYSTYYDTQFDFTSPISIDELERRISILNSYADSALSPTEFVSGQSITGAESNGKITVDLPNRIQTPSFVAYVSADEVRGIGVHQPVSKTQILSVTPPTFPSGENGYVVVEIKNIGDERGAFVSSVTCNQYVSQSGSDVVKYIPAGSTATASIQVTGSSLTAADARCTVNVETMGVDTQSSPFTIAITTQQICVPGTLSCAGEIAQICSPTGGGYIVQDSDRCVQTDIIDDIEDIVDPFDGDGILDDTTVNDILTMILIVVFSIIGLLMFYGILKAVIIKKLT